MITRFVQALIVLLFFSFTVVQAEELYHTSLPLMHTYVEVKAYGDNQTSGIIAETFNEMERINNLLNNYDPLSEVSAINNAAGGNPVCISSETYTALSDAQRYARLSNGAFDFTVGPLISLWGFDREDPGLSGHEPDEQCIARARHMVDYRALVLKKQSDGATARLERSGMRIDTGAFAKGVAADAAIDYLQKKGIQKALVAAGGTIKAIGLKPDGKPWQIGIRHPRNNSSFLTVIELHNQSVSTSGDYEKFYYTAGERRGHIIDPRTGMPVASVQSVTVIAPSASASDTLSTALFVLGPKEGLRLIEEKKDFEALIVTAAGEVVYSSGWPQKTIIY